MKRKWILFSCCALFTATTGCANPTKPVQSKENKPKPISTATQQTHAVPPTHSTSQEEKWLPSISEAMRFIQNRTQIQLMAPTLPIYHPESNQWSIGALAQAGQTQYNVTLQWTKQPLPLNSPALQASLNAGLAQLIGGFGANQYKSDSAAVQQLYQSNPGDVAPAYIEPPAGSSQSLIHLGHGMVGTDYQQPDNSLIVWHEGKWTLQVEGTIPTAISVAKELVNYFNQKLLPETRGTLAVNITGDGNHTAAEWVFGSTLYECWDYRSALEAAKMAVSMRFYPVSSQHQP